MSALDRSAQHSTPRRPSSGQATLPNPQCTKLHENARFQRNANFRLPNLTSRSPAPAPRKPRAPVNPPPSRCDQMRQDATSTQNAKFRLPSLTSGGDRRRYHRSTGWPWRSTSPPSPPSPLAGVGPARFSSSLDRRLMIRSMRCDVSAGAAGRRPGSGFGRGRAPASHPSPGRAPPA